MKHRINLPLRHFFATPPSPCPYLPGRQERKVVTLLAGDEPNQLHQALSQAGFRRSQDLAYRPACENCNACVPVRIPAATLHLNKSQRRIMRRHSVITCNVCPALATEEHYLLFRRYLDSRHGDGGMADMDYADYRAMIEGSPVETHILEFRQSNGTLYGVCLCDQVGDGISLVYSFFDTEFAAQSPGTYLILANVERTRSLGLAYVYLGYWIHRSPKMSYKVNFQPLERLGPDGWVPCPPPIPEFVPNQLLY